MTTMLAGRPVPASSRSSGMLIASSPVKTVASLTNRALKRPSSSRHSTAAAAGAPIRTAARQMICPSCSAGGGCPGTPASGTPRAGYRHRGRAPRPSPAVNISPAPRHGTSAEVPSTPPTSTGEELGIILPDRARGVTRPPIAGQGQQPHRERDQQRPVAVRPQGRPPPGVVHGQPLRVVRGHPRAPRQIGGHRCAERRGCSARLPDGSRETGRASPS